jgi:enoyl-CoA hydratase/carnithine racemase
MTEAIKFAESLKEKSPDAISYTKLLYNNTWLGSIRNALHWETKLQRRLIGRFNQRTAIARSQNIEGSAEFKARS